MSPAPGCSGVSSGKPNNSIFSGAPHPYSRSLLVKSEAKTARYHFSLEDWVDFSRGAASPRKQSQLQRHLARGCVECADVDCPGVLERKHNTRPTSDPISGAADTSVRATIVYGRPRVARQAATAWERSSRPLPTSFEMYLACDNAQAACDCVQMV